MRLAVFRAADDGLGTAERLRALDHDAVLAPVIEIVATGEPVPFEAADALVFTSAHAFAMLGRGEGLSRFRHLPSYCVGGRTAAAARSHGFHNVRAIQSNAGGLAAFMAREVNPSLKLVFVAGRDRKRMLEEGLARLGFTVTVAEVYDARAVPAWSDGVVASLSAEACDGALHYSLRSAQLALRLGTAAGLDREIRAWSHFGLSADITGWLSHQGLARVVAARHPDEQSLLAALNSIPHPNASA